MMIARNDDSKEIIYDRLTENWLLDSLMEQFILRIIFEKRKLFCYSSNDEICEIYFSRLLAFNKNVFLSTNNQSILSLSLSSFFTI